MVAKKGFPGLEKTLRLDLQRGLETYRGNDNDTVKRLYNSTLHAFQCVHWKRFPLKLLTSGEADNTLGEDA
ncbi:hypothetical protein Bind_0054 [Beijerinckia indica subsp. indica ATCC 9039]|uniref:Uncharacterized protein n=1 Tax=Beijerinckia indica subsp. indica (strain ATCC 9039 / DSM 1715 / NCIMB 8712) TaxID=395963 RepID=B2IB13_BEII9|nr:hypothetical protein Bind_0054 [Beijerinckia indica subsp. indica ATCC 9039]